MSTKVSLKKILSYLVNTPMIIETGTSGIWTYRKWNNGVSECWGKWSGSISHYANPLTGFYGYNTTLTFPSNLFTAAPFVTYTAGVGTGFAWPGAYMGSSETQVTCYAIAGLSGTQTVRFEVYAKGTWK